MQGNNPCCHILVECGSSYLSNALNIANIESHLIKFNFPRERLWKTRLQNLNLHWDCQGIITFRSTQLNYWTDATCSFSFSFSTNQKCESEYTTGVATRKTVLLFVQAREAHLSTVVWPKTYTTYILRSPQKVYELLLWYNHSWKHEIGSRSFLLENVESCKRFLDARIRRCILVMASALVTMVVGERAGRLLNRSFPLSYLLRFCTAISLADFRIEN